MKHTFSILPFLLLSVIAFANGDPVAEYCALTLSKTPVPRAIPEIQIEREDLNIELMDGCARIKVDYVLHNTSNKKFKNIHYGFPVDWEGEGPLHWVGDFWSESMYQKGWSDDYVTDFSFRLNNKQLPATMSGDTLLHPVYTSGDWHKEHGYPNWQKIQDSIFNYNREYLDWHQSILSEYEWDGEYIDTLILEESLHRRWYYTSFSIRARETVTLHVEYTLRHTHRLSLYGQMNEFTTYFATWEGKEYHNRAGNRFIYDYSPAAAWGNGRVKELNLNIMADSTLEVWSPEYNYKSAPLFIGNYQKQYTHFDYATAEPIRLHYFHERPDSLDVIAIRNHRLPADKYSIQLHENDTNQYDALKDLSGCTYIELTPRDSGDYVIDILLNEPKYITGLAIMNGNCCDSLSWISNGRIEQMQIMYLDHENDWRVRYGKINYEKRGKPTVQFATCKTDIPINFTWEGLVRAAEKVNIDGRYSQMMPYPFERSSWERPIQQLRILIPKQEHTPCISEIILLYEE